MTPANFVFAVKGSGFITHNKKLLAIETALANFFASGILALEEKLAPIVWQLPATMRFDPVRLAAFLALLPRDTEAAAALARCHDERVEGRCWTRTGTKRRVRHALEVRHPSFFVPELARLARRHRVALVISDAATWQRIEEVTADFVYLRLHGAERTYGSRYTDEELDAWARRIVCWRAGDQPADARCISDRPPSPRRSRDVYVYFDNDFEANAPIDATRLARRVQAYPRVAEPTEGRVP